MAYKFKKKKPPKEDQSQEFENYMIKEWFWYRDETGLHENWKKWYVPQEEIMNWFKKYLARTSH